MYINIDTEFLSFRTFLSFISPLISYYIEFFWTKCISPFSKDRIFWYPTNDWVQLESPLDCKEIQPVHSEGDQPWDFFGRNDDKTETPVLWPPHVKSWLIGKDPDTGRDWGQEEKGTTEDEMAGWHHGLDRRESEWTPGVGDGQGGLGCCNSWGRKESDTTEQLNWTELNYPKGFPGSSAGKESACNAWDPSSIPGSERSTGEGIGYPLQCSWASLVAQW